jgi:hypothetical protein
MNLNQTIVEGVQCQPGSIAKRDSLALVLAFASREECQALPVLRDLEPYESASCVHWYRISRNGSQRYLGAGGSRATRIAWRPSCSMHWQRSFPSKVLLVGLEHEGSPTKLVKKPKAPFGASMVSTSFGGEDGIRTRV